MAIPKALIIVFGHLFGLFVCIKCNDPPPLYIYINLPLSPP